MVFAPMIEIYEGSSNMSVKVHGDTKVLSAVFLQNHAAAKHLHPIL